MNKSLIFASAILFLASSANAQQQPEKEYNLNVTASELNVIGQALGQQTYDKIAPLMAKLQGQVSIQNIPRPIPVETKPEETKTPN